jgi:tetratricopeptide (TPR) repeat protein
VGPPLGAAEADPDAEIAQRHFVRGSQYYAAMDYPHALEEFEAARNVKPLPAFDFNIARCYDRMERFSEARAAYQRYLSSSPPPDDAGEVQRRIEVLDARIAAATSPSAASAAVSPAPAAVAPQPAPAQTSSRSGAKIAGVVIAALGVAALATGIAFAIEAQQASDDMSALDRAMPKVMFDPQRDQAGKTDQLAAEVLLSIGAAAAVAGTVVALVGWRAERRHRVQVQASGVLVRF